MERYDITLYQLKDKIDEYQIDGLSLSNLGDLFFIGQVNCGISLESSFHVCNKAAIDYFKNMGINSISLPFELFPYEAMELSSYNQMTLERTVYGRPPLAQLKYCLLSSTNECINCNACRTKDDFFLFGKNAFIVSINPLRSETTLFPLKKLALPVMKNETNYLRFEFTDESTADINLILSMYANGYYPKGNYIDNIGTI